MKEIAIIICCILVEVILIKLAYVAMDALGIADSIDRIIHPTRGANIPTSQNLPPMPPVKEYARRCSECNTIITGEQIIIVRDDDNRPSIVTAFSGNTEPALHESIICPHCGHQNIISKYYRPLEQEQVKTINDIRRAAGFEPVETLKPYDVTFKPESLREQAAKTLNDYDELINRIVDGAQEDNNGQQ